MVTRINGSVRQGVFFSKDVKFMTLSCTGATFLADLVLDSDTAVTPGVGSTQRIAAVGSALEQVVEIVAQRATVIGVHVGGANGSTTTDVELMLDYAGAYPVGTDASDVGVDGGTILEQLQFDITAIDSPTDITAVAVTVAEGFFPATPGTPT